ncbi:MAG: hypothetical protein J7J93_02050 [Candidatus Aenigmarchaeota archaeon]|nr:hypothetical protein [Candidatus Aenigmarchaeota archaeon]
MKRILIIISLFLFIISYVSAQQIELTHIGYGSTPREIHIHISNKGNITLTDINILVDDQKYKTLEISLSPNKSIEDIIYLNPGKHIVSVESIQGATDSIELNIPSHLTATTYQKTIQENNITAKNKTIIWIGIIVILIIIVVLIWILTKKPKLEY